ncbi:hypothetical protein N9J26_00655 [bacterium]|nr:hypothetical protein [bacterium]
MRSIFFIFLSILLSACSIGTYELRGTLPEAELRSKDFCNITFTLDIQSSQSTHSFGNKAHKNNMLKQLKESYLQSTLSTLSRLGCRSKQASRIAESNFSINISRQLQLSALPQEWLTGLSFGLIPSWGTKYGQYAFTFTHKNSGHSHSYEVDKKSYNHLILFPVFWVTFFTADEQRAYAHALENFLKST